METLINGVEVRDTYSGDKICNEILKSQVILAFKPKYIQLKVGILYWDITLG